LKFIPTKIPDVIEIEPKIHGDSRGFFLETYRQASFAEVGIQDEFVQDNFSRSSQYILRGLHYQIKNPQGKLVRVVSGRVFDVCVDIRKSSPTFGEWVGVMLEADRQNMLWVPPGFAHGFVVLSDVADFAYKCTQYYAPEHERSILWNDPQLNIDWALPKGVDPILSLKDQQGCPLSEAEVFDGI